MTGSDVARVIQSATKIDAEALPSAEVLCDLAMLLEQLYSSDSFEEFEESSQYSQIRAVRDAAQLLANTLPQLAARARAAAVQARRERAAPLATDRDARALLAAHAALAAAGDALCAPLFTVRRPYRAQDWHAVASLIDENLLAVWPGRRPQRIDRARGVLAIFGLWGNAVISGRRTAALAPW